MELYHDKLTKTTLARGTAIIFNNTFEFETKNKIIDKNGNYSIVEISLPNKLSIVLCCIYGPNIDNPVFNQVIEERILTFNNPIVIMGGDWTATLDVSMDNINYVYHNNPRRVKAIKKMSKNLNLVDGWRIANQDSKHGVREYQENKPGWTIFC